MYHSAVEPYTNNIPVQVAFTEEELREWKRCARGTRFWEFRSLKRALRTAKWCEGNALSPSCFVVTFPSSWECIRFQEEWNLFE